jgi:hypothetical protein
VTGTRRHKCAAEGCRAQTSPRMLMCLACWRRVPVETQRALYAVYKRADSSGRAVLTRAYVAAARACVEAVRESRERERQGVPPTPVQLGPGWQGWPPIHPEPPGPDETGGTHAR